MRPVFADSFYFFALLNENDAAHVRAAEFTHGFSGRLVTTGWIVTELADGLAKPVHRREVFLRLFGQLRTNPDVQLVGCSNLLLESGIALYEQRPDKEWSLTDCIFFTVMDQLGIREAATGDHHFEQAGFAALLK